METDWLHEFAAITSVQLDTCLGGLVELVSGDKVDRQVDLDVVGLGLLHQLGDDLGSLGVVQRAADLRRHVETQLLQQLPLYTQMCARSQFNLHQ